MQDTTIQPTPAYTVMVRGTPLAIQCETVEQVVQAVEKLGKFTDREVPIPRVEVVADTSVNPVAQAVYALFREEPRWRRPIEILKALRRRRIADASYNRVYAALRYGDFTQRNGRWNDANAL